MKKIITTVCCLLCFVSSFAQHVRVLSFNMHHGSPALGADSINLEAIAKVIRDSEADLVGVQEVDVRTSRAQLEDQGLKLAQLTGMHYFFSKGIDFDGGEYGTLILAKHKIIGNRRYDLPMLVAGENRSLAIVDVKFPTGQVISFANVHLDVQEQNSVAQAGYITELGDWYDRPLILVGDFNTEPDSKAMKLLETYFTRNTQSNAPTYPSHSPKTEIDYIMLGKQTDFSWKTYKVISTASSDHLPVFAEIELK